jgi:hypothetical protein
VTNKLPERRFQGAGVILALLIAAVGLPSVALAGPFSLFSSANANAGSIACGQTGMLAAACPLVGGTSVSGATGDQLALTLDATAAASTGFGILHSIAGSSGSCTTQGPTCFAEAASGSTSEAGFVDTITITNAPASGFLVFNWLIDGSVSWSCTPSGDETESACGALDASARADLTVEGTDYILGIAAAGAGPGAGGLVLGPLSTPIPFTSIGGTASVPVTGLLDTRSQCGAFASVNGALFCSSLADLSDTAIVSGIQVLAADGSIVAGAGITAASGTDYNDLSPTPAAVPEPASLVLVGSGLLTLMRRVRLRGRGRPPTTPHFSS